MMTTSTTPNTATVIPITGATTGSSFEIAVSSPTLGVVSGVVMAEVLGVKLIVVLVSEVSD